MKTRILIALLQEKDPTGDLECAVGNHDILFVDRQPAYYDGPLQVLERDQANPYYNVTGARVVRSGAKLSIVSHSITDALAENPELPVDCSDANEHSRQVFEHLRAGFKRDKVEKGYSQAARALAAELLGLGGGCSDGGCEVAGRGAQPGAMHTNGGCKCLAYKPDGERRGPDEKAALRAAIEAAAKVLEEKL